MKIKVLALFMVFYVIKLQAQTNFYSMVDSLYIADSATYNLPDSEKVGISKRLERLNSLWASRLAPLGDPFIASEAITNHTLRFYNQGIVPGTICSAESVNWSEVGPYDKINFGSGNNGQIHRITFDPQYNTYQNGVLNQTIYASSFYGGLYKSIDKANNWIPLTDEKLPQSSVSGVAVSYQNSNNIFICTGDGDSFILDYKNGGGTLSGRTTPNVTTGVYRSTDQGVNWAPIDQVNFLSHFGLNGNKNGTCRDIRINPTNDNELFIATTNGLFKSSNALDANASISKIDFSSIPNIVSSDFAGIEYQPKDASNPTSNVNVYAASNNIVMSNDGGITWTSITGTGTGLDFDQLPNNFELRRIKLAVTTANRNFLYAYINGYTKYLNSQSQTLEPDYQQIYIYRYDLTNNSWLQITSNSSANHTASERWSHFPAEWMGLAISPVNQDHVVYSYIQVKTNMQSNNNVSLHNFGTYGVGAIHSDVHTLAFEPNTIDPFVTGGSHGGFSFQQVFTYPLGSILKFGSKNNGINTSLIWGFDVNKNDPEHILIGRQDNGSHSTNNGGLNWSFIASGDGYAAKIFDEGNSYNQIVSSNGTPIVNGGNRKFPYRAEMVANHPNPNSISTYQGVNSNGQVEEYLNAELIPVMFKEKMDPKSGKSIIGFAELYSEYNNSPTFPFQIWKIESDMFDNPGFNWKGFKSIVDFDISPVSPYRTYISTTKSTQVNTTSPLKQTCDFFISNDGLNNGSYIPSSGRKFNESSLQLPTIIGTSDAVYVSGIETHPSEPLTVYISVSGFYAGQKVYKSIDGGLNWINISGCLPNLPANDIFFQEGTIERLYVAMDDGVYVFNQNTGWKKLSGLPNVKIFELLPHYCSNQVFVGTYGRGIWSAPLLPRDDQGHSSQLVINQNTTWNSTKIMESDILIESGSKLTITSTVYMPYGGSIKIEPGAELHVDGGTIKNNCGDFWHGIEVWGDNSKAQNSNDQGVLTLTNGALLENAEEAVQIMQPDQWNTFGGIVNANDATFRNCKRAVSFMSYEDPINGLKNISSFHKCTFELTPDFPSSLTPLSQVTIWDNDGVEFLGCSFEDNRPLLDHEFNTSVGNGIFSLDAGYYVGPYCDMAVPQSPCDPLHIVRSSFKRFNHGILAEGAATSATLVIDQVDFEDNCIATQIETFDQVRFTRNTVKVGGGI